MEAELLALFGLHTLGAAVFGRFEAETAWWRLVLKWCIVLGLTWWCRVQFGHFIALGLITMLAAMGLTFHFWWCRKHGIDPIRATPRKKYYQLRGWHWKE